MAVGARSLCFSNKRYVRAFVYPDLSADETMGSGHMRRFALRFQHFDLWMDAPRENIWSIDRPSVFLVHDREPVFIGLPQVASLLRRGAAGIECGSTPIFRCAATSVFTLDLS